MREETILVAGQPLRLMEQGEGPVLLYLHGASGPNWYPFLELLSARHRIIATEHPGFGRAALPDWLTSVGDLALFYLDLLDTLRLERVHLIGHSLGGWTATELAVRNTARLATVTLIAPAGVATPEAPFGDIFRWSPEEHARNSFHDPRLIEARLQALATADPDVRRHNLRATARLGWRQRLENPQLRHWLHRVDVPVLLVWGREDRICPFAGHRAYLDEIPAARLYALSEAGHALHTERPEELAAAVAAFVAEER